MDGLLSIYRLHGEWSKYPHWFRAHETMRAEAEKYTVSLAPLEPGQRAFVVRGHMEAARREWCKLYAAIYEDESQGGGELPRTWAAGASEEYRKAYDKGICAGRHNNPALALHYFAAYVVEALEAFGVDWERQSMGDCPADGHTAASRPPQGTERQSMGDCPADGHTAASRPPQGTERQSMGHHPADRHTAASRPQRGTEGGGVSLPLELDTDEARAAFSKAVARGWMRPTANGYEWRGVTDRGKGAQLAYFCGKVYGYKWGYKHSPTGGNVGERVPYAALEILFSVRDLHKTLIQAYSAIRPQKWRRRIDDIF